MLSQEANSAILRRMVDTAKPRRRWFQYSLRSLMIFVLFWSLACSWLAVKMQQARRQRAAVERDREIRRQRGI